MRRAVHPVAVLLVVLACLPGCSKNPGTLSKSDVEGKVKAALELKEVSLTENPEGGYKGTGTAEDGTKYELTVTQDEKEKKLTFKAKSEKGQVKNGFIQQH